MASDPEILVAGAGLAGLSAALALAARGWQVALAGPLDLRPTTRTVALLDGSMNFFERLGLRGAIEAQGAPLRVMRIVDDTGSLFRGSPAEFDAEEIGLYAFGWNIENGLLLDILAQSVKSQPRIRMIESVAAGYEFSADHVTATLANGDTLAASLLVACDGAHSLARESAHIPAQKRDWRQTAITAILTHSVSHGDTSTEFHTREGPCTFVPLPSAEDGSYRCSLVWMMKEPSLRRYKDMSGTELAAAIEKAAHFIYGDMKLERGPAYVPIIGLLARAFSAPRLALAGEAAHAFPPIGAQGLNLGLRDVAHLCDCLDRASGADPGDPEKLRRYDALRRADAGSRTFGVNLMNGALLTHLLPADFARAAGLSILKSAGPLRRLAMREGIMPRIDTPAMMRALSSDQPKGL